MPAHPASQPLLAVFLEDPHGKPILRRWKIGFETTGALGGQFPSNLGEIRGTFVQDCSGSTNCGFVRGPIAAVVSLLAREKGGGR
jgi:hypothetical protein